MDCTGVPCFRELTPGQTSWLDALAMFGGRSIITNDRSYAKIALFSSSQSDALAAILLDRPLQSSITVGTIMALYGTPSCLHVYQKSGVLTIDFGSVHVLTRIIHDHFTPFTHVLAIVLGNPVEYSRPLASSYNVMPTDCADAKDSGHLWQGFATMQRYLSGS